LTAPIALSTLNLKLSTCFAQGALTPPGAPGPTMITLSQIEPRTPISTPTNITAGGSYYLMTNIVGVSGGNGIVITANNVTLDLNGFALLGVPGTLDGISFPDAVINVTVRNGTIHGWGGGGVDAGGTASFNLVLDGLNISSNNIGIFAYGGWCMARNCNFQNNVTRGIDLNGNVTGCTIIHSGNEGMDIAGIATDCTVNSNGGAGIVVISGKVFGCFIANNTNGAGISVMSANDCQIIGNDCVGNGEGIGISGSNNRIEGNNVSASVNGGIFYGGIGSDNIIIKNSVNGNGANNYLSLTGQIVGPIITNAVSGIITNSNPWANFSF
jgi:parallel beta-helix repeat protein